MPSTRRRPARHTREVPPSSPAATPNGERRHSKIISRWGGHDCLAEEGFVPVVFPFLKFGAHLKPYGLRPAEALFVLQLMLHKRDEKAPFPGYKTIARRMGISVKYARKIAADLEQKGLMHRVVRVGTTNRFDLTPLFDALAKHVTKQRPGPAKSTTAA